MAGFDKYFLMKAPDAAEYARSKLRFFEPGAELETREIGDGNLNYIFRVVDKKSGTSVVIKQAGDTARISSDMVLSRDRNRIEYDILKLEGEMAPGFVPRLYGYDAIMNCVAMEDLSDHIIMRGALLQRRKYPLFAEHISTFMANTLLLTCDAVMDHKKKKALVGSFINPDLCEITEDLVYTEPFNDLKKRNELFGPNAAFLEKELYGDDRLRLETAKLKFDFFQNAQCLIHGDLHTGSIFVKPDSTKVIDPEFAYYGPAGYDVGNLMANLVFAWVNADSTMDEAAARKDYTAWLAETLAACLDLFKKKWLILWDKAVTEPTARYPGFAEWYLDGVLRDTAGIAGLELCRRTVGLAHVKDIAGIENPGQRARAEKVVISMAKRCIFERELIKSGEDYLRILAWAAGKYPRA